VVEVEPGDLLVVFSDGIAEAVNDTDQEFGDQRIGWAAAMHWEASAEEIRDGILNQVRKFARSAVPDDDRTLTVLRFEHSLSGERVQEPEAVYA
jgi:sigma-B regulation protein RsbU (phosphoserine phosphatase)